PAHGRERATGSSASHRIVGVAPDSSGRGPDRQLPHPRRGREPVWVWGCVSPTPTSGCKTDRRSGRFGRVEGVVAARSTCRCRPLSPWFVQPSPIDWPATLSWSAPAFWLWSIDVLFDWVFDESLLPTSVNCGLKFTLSLWTVAC